MTFLFIFILTVFVAGILVLVPTIKGHKIHKKIIKKADNESRR